MRIELQTGRGEIVATFEGCGLSEPPRLIRWKMRSFLLRGHVYEAVTFFVYSETECFNIPEHWRQE